MPLLIFLLVFPLFSTFLCSRLRSRSTISSGKRHLHTPDCVGDDEIATDHPEIELLFLYDQMFPKSHYEQLSDQLTALFDKLNRQGYFCDLIYAPLAGQKKDKDAEKSPSTDKIGKMVLIVDEAKIPYKKKTENYVAFRPLQVIPQLTLANLLEAFNRGDHSNFLVALSSVGPYHSQYIFKYLLDPAAPSNIADFFDGSDIENAATFLPLHYLKRKEFRLFAAFLAKYKFKITKEHCKRIYDLITVCIREAADTSPFILQAIFDTQQHVLPHMELSLFDLLLKESAFSIICTYFSIVPSPKKSSNLLGRLVNNASKDRDAFDVYLLSMPELDVNALVEIISGEHSAIGPIVLAMLYLRSFSLFESILLHPNINLNGDYKFIYETPKNVADFKWPALPLHLHALLLLEFRKSFQIAFHPLYTRKTNLIHIYDILFVIYYFILINLKWK